MRKMLADSRVPAVKSASGLIAENAGDLAAFFTSDERGRLLPRYLAELSEVLLDERDSAIAEVVEGFEIDSALQGDEGLEMVRRARRNGRPYTIAFVDVRMPPGWSGIETIELTT
jgi:hypothetical protein